jgi:uncharacterized protein YndB with AHSA1/START domain
MPASAEVTLLNDTQIQVVREFDAPRSLVYMAFVTPALVKRWLLGPPGWTMPVCDIDLRIGGKYHYRWESGEKGSAFGLWGTFEAIEPENRLVARESFEDTEPSGEAKVDTLFADHGKATRVTYIITAESREARDAALATGMTDGMEMSFKQLDAILEKQAA